MLGPVGPPCCSMCPPLQGRSGQAHNHSVLFLFCSRMPDIERNCKYLAVQKRIVLKYKRET